MKKKLLSSLEKSQLRKIARSLQVKNPDKLNKEKLILKLSTFPYKVIVAGLNS